MVAVAADGDGLPGLAHVAALRPVANRGDPILRLPPTPPAHLDLDFRAFVRDLEDEIARSDRTREVVEGERAILVSVTAGRKPADLEMQIAELKELAQATGNLLHAHGTVVKRSKEVELDPC